MTIVSRRLTDLIYTDAMGICVGKSYELWVYACNAVAAAVN